VAVLSYLIAALEGYLVGSIPTGYLVARAKGIDIRATGSGNIGATNVLRILGTPAGIFVLVVDGLKGFTACMWGCDLVLDLFNLPLTSADPHLVIPQRIIAGLAVVLGHNFTFWLRFKGGKGIATSAGLFFGLAPLAAGIALATWAMVLAISRYVSLASITAAVTLPTAVWITKRSVLLGVITTVIGLLAIWKHKTNIERLLNGTERRFGGKPTPPEAAK
jgi:glycerol-3-phosphate acyltransferase PlsY